MSDRKFTFGKKERVTGRGRIDALFSSGRAFMAYPFRVTYFLYESGNADVALLVSIPKKRLRKAVDRNRMKRLAREAYRLNKFMLDKGLLPEGMALDVALIYVKNELSTYEDVERGVLKALKGLNYELKLKGGRDEVD